MLIGLSSMKCFIENNLTLLQNENIFWGGGGPHSSALRIVIMLSIQW